MCQYGPRAPSLLSTSGTTLIRRLLWMILTMLPEKNRGAIWVSAFFQNCMAQRKSNLDNISSSNLHKIIILVSSHMFSWSNNRIKPFI